MGIPGLLKEIGKGERVALSKLAIEHLERHNRPLRIAIDAAIWNFQSQSGQGGKNPTLRTLFFRLLRLLALPIQPVFVYDGKNKPLTKRGRTVTRYGGTCVPNELSKVLVKKFSYPWHVAPGEAEAECALLQKTGAVDMVMSQDVDAIMFGAKVTLRDWSKEGTRGNKAPTHVNVIDLVRLKEISGLDCDGMILVALLSGGDYDEAGVAGFGTALACEIARAGFGKDLIDLVRKDDWTGLVEWRDRLQYELETNESGYFKRRHKTLKLPTTFPDRKTLGYYMNPAVSEHKDVPALVATWTDTWNSEIDVPALRQYTADMFDWSWKSGARRFVRCFAQPIFQDRLRRGTIRPSAFSVSSISERRLHFTNDGISELRLSAVPAEVVGIDIEAEEDNPEYIVDLAEEDEEEEALTVAEVGAIEEQADREASVPASPSKKRKSPPWEAYAPEKWWVLETLLQLGLPQVVEDWHQLQRDLRADPRRVASRKTSKLNKTGKQIDTTMKSGAIRGFFTQVEKRTGTKAASESRNKSVFNDDAAAPPVQQPVTPRKPRVKTTSHDSSPSIIRFFQPRVTGDEAVSEGVHCRKEGIAQQTDGVPDHFPNQYHGAGVKTKEQTPFEESFLGTSFSTAIPLDSSPITVALSSTTEIMQEDGRLDHVTLRRSQRTVHQHEEKTSDPSAGHTALQHLVESASVQTQHASQSKNLHMPPSETWVVKDVADLPKPSRSSNSSVKGSAIARESLPGTWRETNSQRGSERRAPRVSYVDLTGD